MNITEELFARADDKYADFQRKLIPNVDTSSFIGVRVPSLRLMAKEVVRDAEAFDEFINTLPHKYYDENLLHSVLLCYIKDYEKCVQCVKSFLPYIDNWAVCDTLSPKVFNKHRESLISDVRGWIESDRPFTVRFGILTLMNRFLDEGYKKEYLEYPAAVKSGEYYVNMMIAWYYATALAKQWDDAFEYIKDGRLDTWVHNKAIQKAVESYRITDEQKEILKTLRKRG